MIALRAMTEDDLALVAGWLREPHVARWWPESELAEIVDEVRRHHPDAGIVVDPDAENRASRRVLERGGFRLIAVRPVATEPDENPMAIYRLASQYSPSPRA